MKKPFFIIYHVENNDQESKFIEAIRSSFIAKKGRDNVYIALASNQFTSKEVFAKIIEQAGDSANFMVIDGDDFYGHFNEIETIDWLKKQIPNTNWTN